VHGRVQGVFFRAYVSRRAEELGLSGYVRNVPDGTVEVVAEGEKDRLDRLTSYLKEGPPGAFVNRVDTTRDDYSGEYSGFSVTH
jgi:acylphosphatase